MNKIVIIPLGDNFLQHLAEDIFQHHWLPEDPLPLSGVTVLIPHRRGAIYLRDYLFQRITAEERRPFFPPKIIAIEDFVDEAAVTREDPPRRSLSPPEQAWVLYGIIKGNPTYGRVATSWDRFFPWGIRLAALLEEIDRELLVPQDIPYPEDVPFEATALLEGLQGIYTAFKQQVKEQGFTTMGKRMRLVAETMDKGPLLTHGPVYLAGFYALTGAEQTIFRYLFNQGAQIFWHADPQDLPALYRRWKDEWHIELDVRGESSSSPTLHFHETSDLHTELLEVQKVLSKGVQRPDQCALILPDPSALIPTLSVLPAETPVNISLGYPLDRTALFSLIEQLTRLQETRDEHGAYYHREYLTLVRHPYVSRLPTSSGHEGRIVLHLLEEKIRRYGKPYLYEKELVDLVTISDDPGRDRRFLGAEELDLEEAQNFIRELHQHLLLPWEDLKSPVDIADVLRVVIQFLFRPFVGEGDFSREHPLDNESLYTLEDSVIPTLENSLFSRQPMGTRLLFSLLQEVVCMARTPFEGYPLVGLQLLGLLETRLLSFDKVIVIDTNEGVVPTQEEVNPLLPEPLKRVLGLAGREKEEAIIRYHFERIIACAHEAHLFWQASIMPASSGLEGRKVRSRFVERLLWRKEKDRGMLLEDAIERAPVQISTASFIRETGMKKRGRDQQKVREFLDTKSLQKGLSASLMNTYLLCPLKFYYHYLLGLRSASSVEEDVDSAALGEIIHQALEDYFSPYRKTTYVPSRDSNYDQLNSFFRERFKGSVMFRSLSLEKRFFLEHAAAYRLKSYLSQMTETTFIDALEQEKRLSLALGLGTFSFFGKVDRIDTREGYRIVLDYKTGRIENIAKSYFENRILPFSLPEEYNHESLTAIMDVIRDLQLPLYVLLTASGKEKELGRTLSAYVELGKRGEEQYFVPPDKINDLRQAYTAWFAGVFPVLLNFLLTHMIESPFFYPATDEKTCRSCDYEPVCRFSSVL